MRNIKKLIGSSIDNNVLRSASSQSGSVTLQASEISLAWKDGGNGVCIQDKVRN